jgi:hypothetical protein
MAIALILSRGAGFTDVTNKLIPLKWFICQEKKSKVTFSFYIKCFANWIALKTVSCDGWSLKVLKDINPATCGQVSEVISFNSLCFDSPFGRQEELCSMPLLQHAGRNRNVNLHMAESFRERGSFLCNHVRMTLTKWWLKRSRWVQKQRDVSESALENFQTISSLVPSSYPAENHYD